MSPEVKYEQKIEQKILLLFLQLRRDMATRGKADICFGNRQLDTVPGKVGISFTYFAVYVVPLPTTCSLIHQLLISSVSFP